MLVQIKDPIDGTLMAISFDVTFYDGNLDRRNFRHPTSFGNLFYAFVCYLLHHLIN